MNSAKKKRASHILQSSNSNMYIVHQHLHQNLAIMIDCSQGKFLLFDFLDLLTGVYLLGHRSLVSGQALERHRVFLRDHYCISTPAYHPGLQHWFALLWNQQIKRSVGASNSYDIHQTTRHCQQSFSSQLNRFGFNLRHFPLWNLEQLIGEEARKQMLLSPFKRSRENRASSRIYFTLMVVKWMFHVPK